MWPFRMGIDMSNTVFRQTETEKGKMRIIIESPESAKEDEEIKDEVREILFSALGEQLREFL